MKIAPHDNGTYLVESVSRPGEVHIVDVDERTCSCERHHFTKGQSCAHLEAALRFHFKPKRPKSGSVRKPLELTRPRERGRKLTR